MMQGQKGGENSDVMCASQNSPGDMQVHYPNGLSILIHTISLAHIKAHQKARLEIYHAIYLYYSTFK